MIMARRRWPGRRSLKRMVTGWWRGLWRRGPTDARRAPGPAAAAHPAGAPALPDGRHGLRHALFPGDQGDLARGGGRPRDRAGQSAGRGPQSPPRPALPLRAAALAPARGAPGFPRRAAPLRCRSRRRPDQRLVLGHQRVPGPVVGGPPRHRRRRPAVRVAGCPTPSASACPAPPGSIATPWTTAWRRWRPWASPPDLRTVVVPSPEQQRRGGRILAGPAPAAGRSGRCTRGRQAAERLAGRPHGRRGRDRGGRRRSRCWCSMARPTGGPGGGVPATP